MRVNSELELEFIGWFPGNKGSAAYNGSYQSEKWTSRNWSIISLPEQTIDKLNMVVYKVN